MKVRILQGASGAGKSTYTKKLGGKVLVCSADDFFIKEGTYQFNSSLLNQAHAHCLKRFTEFMVDGADNDSRIKDWVVVVDNTNTTTTEIAPYYQVAAAFGHDVEIVTINVEPDVAWARNVHQVPASTVKSQTNRIKESHRHFPKWWKHTTFTPV